MGCIAICDMLWTGFQPAGAGACCVLGMLRLPGCSPACVLCGSASFAQSLDERSLFFLFCQAALKVMWSSSGSIKFIVFRPSCPFCSTAFCASGQLSPGAHACCNACMLQRMHAASPIEQSAGRRFKSLHKMTLTGEYARATDCPYARAKGAALRWLSVATLADAT
jgi:hypothetical protein